MCSSDLKQTKTELFKTNLRFIKFLKNILVRFFFWKNFYKSEISFEKLHFGLFLGNHPRMKNASIFLSQNYFQKFSFSPTARDSPSHSSIALLPTAPRPRPPGSKTHSPSTVPGSGGYCCCYCTRRCSIHRFPPTSLRSSNVIFEIFWNIHPYGFPFYWVGCLTRGWFPKNRPKRRSAKLISDL